MGRPKNADGQRTRQAILDAALELFADKGYFGTSLRDVAAAVGVRESALYNYFKSKEALFEALILAHEHTRSERLAPIADGAIADGRLLLERLALASLEDFLAPREQMMFRLLMSDGIRLARTGRINLYERLASGRERLQEIMRRLIREGWLRKADPHLLALTFAGPLMVWRQCHAIGIDLPMIRNPRAFARQHVEQFLQGAAVPPPRRPVVVARKRRIVKPARLTAALLLFAALTIAGCSRSADAERATTESLAVNVTAVEAVEEPIKRFIRVSGTLTAQEDAQVAAEVAGRVVATPVERGSRVGANAELIRIAAAEGEAQAVEAQANAAQIEARLGIAAGEPFAVERVPEVANARAALELSRTEFERAHMLHEKKLLSQSEFDQRKAQTDAAERQYDVARNGAAQQYQALLAARARVTMARKALADTTVRSPFSGVVGERFVSVGDYVTRGTKVATVMRVDPLRVELTVPEQYVSAVATGRAVTFEVDAYPGETFTGQVRYVSPSVTSETRALTLEAVVPNGAGRLKPGFFATAQIEQATPLPGIMVPRPAVRTVSGTARVFVIAGDRAEERIVTTGQTVGERIEITSGLKAGERVAAGGVERLVDGVRVVSAR
jgi:RND family efflux transporter MFP subunit